MDAVFAPTASGDLRPAPSLVYDDAPWLSKSTTSQHTFVHPKISSDVGEKIGVKSLRRQLVSTNAETLDFGVSPTIENAEAFGQAESLTRRLRNIIEMYPEGPSILSELVQNADDSGATTVKVLISRKSSPSSSLLGPKMRAWQGPSIYVYNDSTFSERDFQNLSRIGQASKLDKLVTTGRFGLGFNAVFHWTDVPSFVSGDHLVMFDPHEKFVPGATSTSRGIKIKYSDSALLEQFPDQFQSYCKFGCDMKTKFNGTLFRFPLRDAQTARESEISKSSWGDAELDEMLDNMKEVLPRFLLFLRNVKRIEVYTEGVSSSQDSSQDSSPTLLYTAGVAQRLPLDHLSLLGTPVPKKPSSSSLTSSSSASRDDWRSIPDFIVGSPSNPLSKEAFYTKLLQTPESSLPSTQHLTSITFTSPTASTSDVYLVCVALGGGRCREFAANEKYRRMKFIPWGGVAAHLTRDGAPAAPLAGSAYCFLPLPVGTGMPVHVNGYFELSANRRDIWLGSDMTGEGRVRSDWNELLLSDVVAPLYAVLLLQARELVPRGAYNRLFPTVPGTNAAQYSVAMWKLATRALYSKESIMDLPLLWCNSQVWVSPNDSVVVEEKEVTAAAATNGAAVASSDDGDDALTAILLKEELPVVALPAKLMAMLTANECKFSHATPSFVRSHFKDVSLPHPALKELPDALFLFKYAASDLAPGPQLERLNDLPFLPLCSGALGTIRSFGNTTHPNKFTVSPSELELLQAARSEIVDTGTGNEAVDSLLKSSEFHASSNVRRLDRAQFLHLLQFVFPGDWEYLEEVAWDARAADSVSEEWVSKFWAYAGKSFEEDGVTVGSGDVSGSDGGSTDVVGRVAAGVAQFEGTFPLLPCLASGDRRILMTIAPDLPVILPTTDTSKERAVPSSVTTVLQKIGIKVVDAAVFGKDSFGIFQALEAAKHVQAGSALGCVRAIANLFPEGIENGDLTRRVYMRFRDTSGPERETLRLYVRDMLQSEGVEKITDADKRILKALPIFPTFDKTDPYMDLLIDERWMAPEDTNSALLDSSFVKVGDRRDLILLENLNVKRMEGRVFWAKHGVPTMMKGGSELRDAGGSQLLREIPRLIAVGAGQNQKSGGGEEKEEEEEFLRMLRKTPFVVNRAGGVVAPEALFDPDVSGLSDLLGDESFPSATFCSGDVLAGLRALGMKRVLTCRGVIESARSVGAAAAAAATDDDQALRRSKFLLRFVDDNIESLLQQCRDEDDGNPAYGRAGGQRSVEEDVVILGDIVDLDEVDAVTSGVPRGPVPFPLLDKRTIEGRFVEQLATLRWMPCVTTWKDDLLPPHRSNEQQQGFESSVEMRPKEDAYLCSANKHLLDGFVSSDVLKRCFGWDKDVDIKSVAFQLIALSTVLAERGRGLPNFRQTLASVVPRMYTLLDSHLEGTREKDGTMELMNECQAMLARAKWLWVGDDFVTVDRVAFEATNSARPHLFAVPAELECFSGLLKYFGVRDKFIASDYVRVNAELYFMNKDAGTLTAADLDLAVGMAKLLAGLDKDERDDSLKSGGQVYLPSERGVLMKVEDMVYDDAPWLSASIGQTKVKMRFVHSTLGPPSKAAQVLGARSLREVLLANQSGMQNIPCPSAESLHQLLGARVKKRSVKNRDRTIQEDAKVVMDLLEVAENAGVESVKILADNRTHKDESLLHPGLSSGQGPSLLVCFQDHVMNVDELVRLSAPSGYYRSASSRMDGNGGLPRLGSGLCSLYQYCDCLQVLSGNQLHLFDPTGTYLFGGGKEEEEEKEGEEKAKGDGHGSKKKTKKKKKSKVGQPIARRYGLDTADMFENFGDQFTPFVEATFGVQAKQFFNGTVFRICFRRKASSISSRTFGTDEIGDLLSYLEPRLGQAFLFTRSLKSIEVDVHEAGAEAAAQVCKSRLRTSGRVRRDHVEKFHDNVDWKKSKLASMFKSWTPVRSTFTLEVSHVRSTNAIMKKEKITSASATNGNGSGGGSKAEDIVDSYLITSLLAPPGVREMAASDAFRKLGVSPLLRMAAHVHRSVGGMSVKFKSLPGTLFVGLDSGVRTGLPVSINAAFFLHELNQSVLLDPRDDSDVRELFPRIRQTEEQGGGRKGSSSSSIGSPMAARGSVSLWDFNRELLTSSIGQLIPELLCELKHPLEYLYSRDPRLIYRYWPRFEMVRAKFQKFVTPSLYAELSLKELYLTKHDGFKSIADGVFESKDFPLGKKVGAFFRSKFSMFSVPGDVAHDIQISGCQLKTLSPKMARSWLKRTLSS